jgi:beta-glucanase (GH16 family)
MNPKRNAAFRTALACLAAVCPLLPLAAAAPPSYQLVWADEFDGTALDTSKWHHRGLGERRGARNVTNAVAVAGGFLTITTYTAEGKHHTGMIGTEGRFERSFGYYEARIRFEGSPGMWSAFWSQTPTMGSHIGDPAQAGMEIDILEHRVTDKDGKNIGGKVQHTLHWDGYGPEHKSRTHLTEDLGLNSGFHIYGFEWTSTEYRCFIDGKLTWTSGPVSKRLQYLILSCEVQDNGWAGKIPPAGYGDLASSRTRMVVDYVRYYAPVANRDE